MIFKNLDEVIEFMESLTTPQFDPFFEYYVEGEENGFLEKGDIIAMTKVNGKPFVCWGSGMMNETFGMFGETCCILPNCQRPVDGFTDMLVTFEKLKNGTLYPVSATPIKYGIRGCKPFSAV